MFWVTVNEQPPLPPPEVPHLLGVPPPPQVAGEVQVPQEETVRLTPQLSVPLTEPQFLPRREQKVALDSGVQLVVPQTLATPPPPQVAGEVQVPQEETVRVTPQLSAPVTEPQFFPLREQKLVLDSGVQRAVPQTLAVPPPPQVAGEVQVPQEETVRATPQLSVPLTEPQFFPSREQKVVLDSGVQVEAQVESLTATLVALLKLCELVE